jgi:AraC-like DNA-binding protein
MTLAVGTSLATAVLSVFMTLPMLALARRRSANAWLALLVLTLGALSFCDSGVLRGPLFGVLDWTLAVLGPLYYGYVRSLTGLGNGWRQAWHFLPALAAAAAFAWLRAVLSALPSGVDAPHAWVLTFEIVLFGSQASAVLYMCAVLWRLRQHRRRVRACFSETAQRDLVWLAWLSAATLALLVLWVLSVLTAGVASNALFVGRMALLFFIGWYGMRQSLVFVPVFDATTPLPGVAPDGTAPVPAAATPADSTPPKPSKYARSGLNDSAVELIAERLAKRMQSTHDYLESDITLAQLAERIGTSPQWLSQYLNKVLGTSFFDYINGLRVSAVQESMRDSSTSRQSLLELAFAAGFNSKSTFNLAFKKRTGLAPSAWRATHAAASDPIR